MMIEEAPREDHHHHSHLLNYQEDYSSDPNHPSNTVNMVDYEDSSFTESTSLKNEMTPFPNRVFDYDISKISKANLHSNHRVE